MGRQATTSGKATTTTDHSTIKKWAEERGGKPTVVKETRGNQDTVGVLRIDFPGYSGEDSLKEISWEEFFETFDKKKLAFLYQDESAEGEESRFFKLVER